MVNTVCNLSSPAKQADPRWNQLLPMLCTRGDVHRQQEVKTPPRIHSVSLRKWRRKYFVEWQGNNEQVTKAAEPELFLPTRALLVVVSSFFLFFFLKLRRYESNASQKEGGNPSFSTFLFNSSVTDHFPRGMIVQQGKVCVGSGGLWACLLYIFLCMDRSTSQTGRAQAHRHGCRLLLSLGVNLTNWRYRAWEVHVGRGRKKWSKARTPTSGKTAPWQMFYILLQTHFSKL